MKKVFVFLFTTTIIVACNNQKEEKEKTIATDQSNTPATADPATDSAAIRTVVLDFYNWYYLNYTKLMDYKLYESVKKNDATPYKINWKEVERYQSYIRDSAPQLGDEFLKHQKVMFTRADSAFKVDIDSDVPYYFDYDWYTNSQESPGYLLNGISKSQNWVIKVNGDKAWAEIGAPVAKDYLAGSLLLYVGLKKGNGQWTISTIGND